MIHASIPWTPKTKDRPRHGRNGHSYTPTATKKAEAAIVAAFAEKGLIPDVPCEEPLAISIFLGAEAFWIDVEVVSPHSEKHLGGRDVDNMAKLILDALDKVVYKNDKQIVDLRMVKM